MDNTEFTFMLISGLGLIIFNKAFAKSALKQRIALGIKVTENDLPKGRIFTIVAGILIIFLAFFFRYLQWIETHR